MNSAKRNRPAIEKGQCAAPPREGRYTPSCLTSTPRGKPVSLPGPLLPRRSPTAPWSLRDSFTEARARAHGHACGNAPRSAAVGGPTGGVRQPRPVRGGTATARPWPPVRVRTGATVRTASRSARGHSPTVRDARRPGPGHEASGLSGAEESAGASAVFFLRRKNTAPPPSTTSATADARDHRGGAGAAGLGQVGPPVVPVELPPAEAGLGFAGRPVGVTGPAAGGLAVQDARRSC